MPLTATQLGLRARAASLGVQARRGGVAWSPRNLPGLALWLAADKLTGLADGAAVATWPDASGNGRDAAQATAAKRPTYRTNVLNGKPVLRFDGVDDGLATPSITLAATTGVTLFAVVTGLTTGTDQAIAEFSANVNNNNGAFMLYRAASGKLTGLLKSAAGIANLAKGSPFGGADTAALSATYDIPQAAGAEIQIDADYAWHRLHNPTTTAGGEMAGTTTGSANNTGAFGSYPLYLGARGAASLYLAGDVAEVLLYASVLSASDRYRVARYLGQKYGRRPHDGILVYDGDSLTEGNTAPNTFAANPYPRQVDAALTRRYASANFGVSGQTLAQMAADAAAQVDRLYSPASPVNALVVWGGTNDMVSVGGNQTAATTHTRLADYCAARRAAGWAVHVLTCLPRSDAAAPADFETKRQALNASIRANWATYADGLIDVAADTRIGDAGDELNTTYYTSDKVHLNETGYGVIAELVKAALGLA